MSNVTQRRPEPGSFRTKRELAIGTLRDAIQSGRYAPGQQLSQTQLMTDFGMGSTPVREAVLELLARGVLVQESHHSVRGPRQLGGWPACEMELSQVAGRDGNVRCSQLRRLPFPG